MTGTIVVEGLTKVFHTTARHPGLLGAARNLVAPVRVPRTAVDALSFTVPAGQLIALLGPNGAGKSTTIKMLAGILTPSAGRVEVNGIVPHRERIANAYAVGAVFGQRSQLWRDLPARASLEILRDIYDVSAADYRARFAEFDRILELRSFWDTPTRQLSLGQRVRCDLAAALIHDPTVVFLDEPTIGMDVVVKEQVREFLRHQVRERGRTIVLTTHDMADVARLAERVALIGNGRLVYDGTIERLRRVTGATWHIRVTLDGPLPESGVAGALVVRTDGDVVTFEPDRETEMEPRDLVRRLIAHLPVVDLAVEEPDLEAVVLDLLRRTGRQQDGEPLATGSRR